MGNSPKQAPGKRMQPTGAGSRPKTGEAYIQPLCWYRSLDPMYAALWLPEEQTKISDNPVTKAAVAPGNGKRISSSASSGVVPSCFISWCLSWLHSSRCQGSKSRSNSRTNQCPYQTPSGVHHHFQHRPFDFSKATLSPPSCLHAL